MKYLFIFLGFLFTILGAVGIFLPILPTVPFLLLASICFAKGSKRFHNWFKSTKLYKNNLESFEKDRSMTLKTKWSILIPVTILLLVAFFMMKNIYGRTFIAVLILAKYYVFLFKIKTVSQDNLEN